MYSRAFYWILFDVAVCGVLLTVFLSNCVLPSLLRKVGFISRLARDFMEQSV